MGDESKIIAKLQGLYQLSEPQGGLDQTLSQLAAMAAKIMNSHNASIMLLGDGEFEELTMRVFAHYGDLPQSAYQQLVAKGEGISGHVLETGKPLLVENIEESEFASMARGKNGGSKSFLSAPILINSKIIGVVNISDSKYQRPFNLDDLALLDIVALFVGKSIQVSQLESLLKSRFAQLAVASEEKTLDKKGVGDALAPAIQNPDQMAKILAKSFFKEMTKAGFGSSQIINAASEIISLLSTNLQKHSKRIDKKKP